MENIIDVQAARSGVDLTQAEARASGIEVVTAKLNPPKKPKLAEDTSGNLRFEKLIYAEKMYYGEISRTGNECIHLIKHCYSSKKIVDTESPL